MPPTYLQFSRRLKLTMFGDLPRWVAGASAMDRQRTQIGAIFNSFISNMDRIVPLECQFSLALVLVIRYVRGNKKLEKMRPRRKYWGGQCFKGEQIMVNIILCSQSCGNFSLLFGLYTRGRICHIWLRISLFRPLTCCYSGHPRVRHFPPPF